MCVFASQAMGKNSQESRIRGDRGPCLGHSAAASGSLVFASADPLEGRLSRQPVKEGTWGARRLQGWREHS